jgi:hypothetical protein
VGVCIDEKVDDVGYMELLVRTVIKRLPVVRSQVRVQQTENWRGIPVTMLSCEVVCPQPPAFDMTWLD